jgi:hypothetical protein
VEAGRKLWAKDYRPNTSSVDFNSSRQSSLTSSQNSKLRQPLSKNDCNERPRKRMKYSNIDELIKQQRRLPHPLKVGDELTLYLNAELETDDDLVSFCQEPFPCWLAPTARHALRPPIGQLTSARRLPASCTPALVARTTTIQHFTFSSLFNTSSAQLFALSTLLLLVWQSTYCLSQQ